MNIAYAQMTPDSEVKKYIQIDHHNYFANKIFLLFPDLDTLPTFQNRRLIISCWWSKIRHPNLFGEILLHLALLVPTAFKFNCPAFTGILLIIVYLIYRSIIINKKNALKYESSWQRYSALIKYNLLPGVY